VFLLANLGRPWKRERKRDINGGSWWKCVEVVGKLEKLVACGGRKELKKKEKGKEIHRRRYFLGLKK